MTIAKENFAKIAEVLAASRILSGETKKVACKIAIKLAGGGRSKDSFDPVQGVILLKKAIESGVYSFDQFAFAIETHKFLSEIEEIYGAKEGERATSEVVSDSEDRRLYLPAN